LLYKNNLPSLIFKNTPSLSYATMRPAYGLLYLKKACTRTKQRDSCM